MTVELILSLEQQVLTDSHNFTSLARNLARPVKSAFPEGYTWNDRCAGKTREPNSLSAADESSGATRYSACRRTIEKIVLAKTRLESRAAVRSTPDEFDGVVEERDSRQRLLFTKASRAEDGWSSCR